MCAKYNLHERSYNWRNIYLKEKLKLLNFCSVTQKKAQKKITFSYMYILTMYDTRKTLSYI